MIGIATVYCNSFLHKYDMGTITQLAQNDNERI